MKYLKTTWEFYGVGLVRGRKIMKYQNIVLYNKYQVYCTRKGALFESFSGTVI